MFDANDVDPLPFMVVAGILRGAVGGLSNECLEQKSGMENYQQEVKKHDDGKVINLK